MGIGHPPEENLLNIKEENKTKLRKIGLTYLKKDFLEKQSTLESKLAYSKGKKKLDIFGAKKLKGKKSLLFMLGIGSIFLIFLGCLDLSIYWNGVKLL